MPKKSYVKPKLVKYGTVSKLTATKTGTFADGKSAKMMIV
ncbi:MAG: lasso RiPP family leader peptide-containing protein [Candidatus Binataceae bacterium]|nr:lasso RiPP family leader peptide-containing protein [Candidatus Binataceae bacterium]